jgi:hypothetical protein
VCTPDLDQACSECGCAAWEAPAVPTGAPECVVFYKGAFGHTCFAEAKCSTSGCNGRAVVDGYEYGLLRQSTKYAFCHTLLYSWRHQLVPYPRPWYHFWRSTLQDYKNASQQVCPTAAQNSAWSPTYPLNLMAEEARRAISGSWASLYYYMHV